MREGSVSATNVNPFCVKPYTPDPDTLAVYPDRTGALRPEKIAACEQYEKTQFGIDLPSWRRSYGMNNSQTSKETRMSPFKLFLEIFPCLTRSV